jgi:hypothetical protein
MTDLKEILRLHGLYLIGAKDGVRAILSEADLSEADLSGANLSGANLSRANLSRAILSGANLSRANLDHTKGLYSFYLGAHIGYLFQVGGGVKHLNIGCVSYTLDHWSKHYICIGEKHGYAPQQIELYGRMIEFLSGMEL